MRELHVEEITKAVAEMYVHANYFLGEDVKERISECARCETSQLARDVFASVEENMRIAAEGVFPICQDTGMACVFLEIGQDVHLAGGNLHDAINEGVRRGCAEGYLRQTIVEDPFRRKNTGDSTPADINIDIVPGDKVKIIVAPKGFGSENMSQIKMLTPGAGVKGAEDFIVKVCEEAGGRPCPPIVVGVGIGGNFNKAARFSGVFTEIGSHFPHTAMNGILIPVVLCFSVAVPLQGNQQFSQQCHAQAFSKRRLIFKLIQHPVHQQKNRFLPLNRSFYFP